jgi:hypothetical protein
MRYLRQQVLNRRAPYDQRLYVDMTDSIVMTTTNNMLMPKGTTAERPVSPVTGMMRYNTSTNQVEVYQGSSATWRSIRYKEATGITRETYTGDGTTSVYGPLSVQPPTTVESGATWTGDNLIVIVGNVYQTWTSNYLIVTGSTLGSPYDTPPNDTKYYIQFTSASPGLSTPIVILHGFDQ